MIEKLKMTLDATKRLKEVHKHVLYNIHDCFEQSLMNQEVLLEDLIEHRSDSNRKNKVNEVMLLVKKLEINASIDAMEYRMTKDPGFEKFRSAPEHVQKVRNELINKIDELLKDL